MIGIGIEYGPSVDTSIRIYDVTDATWPILINEVYPSDMSRFLEDASRLAEKHGIEFTDQMYEDFIFSSGVNMQTCKSFKRVYEWRSWTTAI